MTGLPQSETAHTKKLKYSGFNTECLVFMHIMHPIRLRYFYESFII